MSRLAARVPAGVAAVLLFALPWVEPARAYAAVSPSAAATYVVGAHPTSLAVNPAGTVAIVANADATSVSRINLTAGTVTTIAITGRPRDVAIDATGTYAYVTSYVAEASTGLVTRILLSDSTITPITVGADPQAIALDHAGNYAYVKVAPSSGDRIDLDTLHVDSAFISVAYGLFLITADDSVIYSLHGNGNTGAKFRASDGAVLASVYTQNPNTVGAGFNADGSYIYVVDHGSGGWIRRASTAIPDGDSVVFDGWINGFAGVAGHAPSEAMDWISLGDTAYIPGDDGAVWAVGLSALPGQGASIEIVASGLGKATGVAAPRNGSFLLVSDGVNDRVLRFPLDPLPNMSTGSSIGSITPATSTIMVGDPLTVSSVVTPEDDAIAETCDVSGSFAPSYALDADPTGEGTTPFALASGPVSTTGWRPGTYTMTVSYPGDGTCEAAEDDSTVLTVAAAVVPVVTGADDVSVTSASAAAEAALRRGVAAHTGDADGLGSLVALGLLGMAGSVVALSLGGRLDPRAVAAGVVLAVGYAVLRALVAAWDASVTWLPSRDG